ncbi:MAG: hypothetical protein ACAI44_39800 [Candidatus Sericytochromatia bacterium]
MAGPLTDTEKAQILDHLGWSIGLFTQNYPHVYVKPVLNGLSDEASLAIVRAHLTRLNAIYDEQAAIIPKFKLSEVKGIKFSDDGELRLWGLYGDWVAKLASALDVNANPDIYGGGGGRPIIYHD